VADVITINGDYTVEWDGEAVNIDELPGTARRMYPPVVDTIFWERV